MFNLTSILEGMMQHALQSIAQSLGIDEPIAWLVLTIIIYLFFGFGRYIFDKDAWRFRDKVTGRFVKWETVLCFGTTGNICFFLLIHESMSSVDQYYWFLSLVMCTILTIIIGISTRK